MSEKQFDVVVVGSCNYDFINVVERFPVVGETVKSRRFSTAFGGKGANQAVQCAKLGAKVAMVGKLGKDAFRLEYLKNFDECGVDR
uniref:Carbohydrate kinase PfkB domain-containing protein n=1 Tax=Romanomermis culicivorax TaxID=13658 RepID=A0A915JJW7_ROMCU